MTKGSVAMLLDCGGGTVDITVHKLLCEVHENFICKEIIPSSGGCEWGSKYVFFIDKIYAKMGAPSQIKWPMRIFKPVRHWG